ncbi:tubby C-terminal-like domain-containing protein [Aspergillus egyptiacus]|nr:tubby C-terminal-like domain-containing protein [Aspergillus egyptiacus]
MAELTDLKQPIAIRTEYTAPYLTTLHIKQHGKSKHDVLGESLTVWRWPDGGSQSQDERKLFSVGSESVPFRQRRHVRDASGLPLFELSQKKAGVTWFVHLPGGKETSESIAAIAPRWNPLRNKLDVYVRNAARDGTEVKLKVRGQDVSKAQTNVYFDGALVMIATRFDDHRSLTELEWKVEVARGMDISLASVIVVAMAYMLHRTGASLYRGAGDSPAAGK